MLQTVTSTGWIVVAAKGGLERMHANDCIITFFPMMVASIARGSW
jgi:hypothetical protein